MTNEFYMQLAIDKAWQYQGLTYPNPTVGAVIVLEHRILSIESHQKAGTSHAEVLALLTAYEKLTYRCLDFDKFDAIKAHTFLRNLEKDFFSKCRLYVTLEPCSHQGKTPSCSLLLQHLNLKHITIGTNDPIKGHDKGAKQLQNITMGVLEKKCEDLLEPFRIWQSRAFVLFKLAQTTNAQISSSQNNGYLSSDTSLIHVHKLRNACDTLLIGGNTVRVDRPTLDCRLIDAKAADVAIYSKSKKLDKEIPLFKVKHRDVKIVDDLKILDTPSFVLVEGGEGMLQALKEKIDWLLIYQTPKLSSNNLTYNTDMNLSFLHIEKKDIDMMIWSRHLGN